MEAERQERERALDALQRHLRLALELADELAERHVAVLISHPYELVRSRRSDDAAADGVADGRAGPELDP